MAAIGYTYSNRFLNSICEGTPFTLPAGIYVALTTSASSDAGLGTEAAYTGYTRVSAAGLFATVAASGSISNSGVITFPACTGGSSTVTGFALMDAATGGNIITWGPTTASLAISSGITPSFAIGALTVSDL